MEESFPHCTNQFTSFPSPSQNPLQPNPEQTLLHVWPVFVSCSLNALLHGLSQLPQLLDFS